MHRMRARPRPGQTKQFVDFVDQWVPAAEGADRRKLYRVRSAITHGGKLLRTDLDSPGHYTHPEWNEQRGDFDVAQRVARLAGINWLLAQRSS
jgi:hypothetical protein